MLPGVANVSLIYNFKEHPSSEIRSPYKNLNFLQTSVHAINVEWQSHGLQQVYLNKTCTFGNANMVANIIITFSFFIIKK